MINVWGRFRSDRRGAVTTDYVMLAAALIAMSLSGIYAVRAGAFDGVRGILNAVDQSTSCSTTNANSTDLTRCN